MDLSFSDLKKRDVINVSDGSNLGHVSNVIIRFPEGRMVGIAVPGRRKRGIFALFDKTELYIDEQKIIKIGGDVILVNLNASSSHIPPPPPPPPPHCPPPHPSQNKKHCPPSKPDCRELFGGIDNGEEY